jgi:hypothetical protein
MDKTPDIGSSLLHKAISSIHHPAPRGNLFAKILPENSQSQRVVASPAARVATTPLGYSFPRRLCHEQKNSESVTAPPNFRFPMSGAVGYAASVITEI